MSWIEPSRAAAERVYLVLDGHRSDDDRARLLVSEDRGATWRSIVSDLPAQAGTTRVLREDPVNHDLLYLGTEFGAFCSLDRGAHWRRLGGNLPTVAVHAFAIHPTVPEIVAATHGRSLWVLDVQALRQWTPGAAAAAVTLYEPRAAVAWRPQPRDGETRTFVGENPPEGVSIAFSFASDVPAARLVVLGGGGREVRELETPTEAGFHEVLWDLREAPPEGRQARWRRGARVATGTYQVRLVVGEKTFTQPLTVRIDPSHPDERWITFENEAEVREAERLAARAASRGEDADLLPAD